MPVIYKESRWEYFKARVDQQTGLLVQDGIDDIESETKRSILQDAKTGRIYGSHQASAPGESPANDTGELIAGMSTSRIGMDGSFFSDTFYSMYLEFGTPNMAPRPHLRPAFAYARSKVRRHAKKRLGRLR